jgi:hypothetical protein
MTSYLELAPAYTYYRKNSVSGTLISDDWKEISADEMKRTINAHFEEEAREDWTGSTKPSRATALDHLHSSQTLYTYTYDYRAESK